MAEQCTISELLNEADLLCYEHSMRTILRLRFASDISYVDEKDLTEIGMSRPEQKRLKAVYYKKFPKGSIMGKLKRKILGKGETRKVEHETPHDTYDQHVIPLEKITLSKQLGQGEFGAVYQAAWNNTNNEHEQVQVAVKCISPEKLLANPINFLQEAAIMHKMRHDCIVRLYGVVFDTKVVSELAACGSLLECLRNSSLRDSFMVDLLCDFSAQIARGMEYLSNERLIHRDLAARNVLVFAPDKVKISDFGLSRSLGMGEDYYRSEFTENMKLPIAWCAPESINFLKFTSASDVWSYGVTLFEIFSYGEMPWGGFTGAEILAMIDYPRLERLKRPDSCPIDIYKLMLQSWAHVPEERPCFSDIVQALPELVPQSLITVTACHDGVCDHLQYDKNEVIFVLDKFPSAYPDGYFWQGTMKNRRIGLFRPDETVAKLAVEMPSNKHEHSTGSGFLAYTSTKAHGGDREKDKKNLNKLMISEPQGDVRHTCHVGVDGTTFGLLQFNKKEIGATDGIVNCQRRSISVPVGCAPPPISPQMSVSSNAQSCTENVMTEKVSPPLFPKSMNPPPIPVAPKPGKYYARRTNTCTVDTTTCDTITTALSNSSTDTELLTSDDRFLLSLPRSKSNPPIDDQFSYLDGGIFSSNNRSSKMDNNGNHVNILTCDDSSTNTDFYLRNDFHSDDSDRKPLLTKRKVDFVRPSANPKNSMMRFMSEAEFEKLGEKSEREHKKADRQLENVRRKEDTTWRQVLERTEESETGSFSGTIGTSASDEWNEEAQKAYKLLVQCGEHLRTSVNNAESSEANEKSNRLPPRPLKKSVDPPNVVNKAATEKTSPPTVIPKTTRVKFAEDVNANSDNDKSITAPLQAKHDAAKKLPPPVPPKPKVRLKIDEDGS